MQCPRRMLVCRARWGIAWGLLLFACGQMAVNCVVERAHPEWRDWEYGSRLTQLRQILAAHPGHPLLLIVGSSRTAWGLDPEALPPLRANATPKPLVYNFSMLGGGPVIELIVLRRLLDQGICPRWLVVEVWPLCLTERSPHSEEANLRARALRWPELGLVGRLFGERQQTIADGCADNLLPLLPCRHHLLRLYAKRWHVPNPPQDNLDQLSTYSLNAAGWRPCPWPRWPDSELRARMVKDLREYKRLLGSYTIGSVTERAHRRLLTDCARRGIRVLLLRMPDSSAWRGVDSPIDEQLVTHYLQRLSEEFGVPVADASRWCGDEQFTDSLHLLPESAGTFTQRIGAEVLPSFLDQCVAASAR